MKYSITVSLSNGKEIPFNYEGLNSVSEIRSSILDGTSQPWYYFKNAWGEGYFLKDKVVSIVIKEIK